VFETHHSLEDIEKMAICQFDPISLWSKTNSNVNLLTHVNNSHGLGPKWYFYIFWTKITLDQIKILPKTKRKKGFCQYMNKFFLCRFRKIYEIIFSSLEKRTRKISSLYFESSLEWYCYDFLKRGWIYAMKEKHTRNSLKHSVKRGIMLNNKAQNEVYWIYFQLRIAMEFNLAKK
jgi:hypothetical protein